MGSRGISLIELVVVVSIIGILVVSMGFTYGDWRQKYEVERATREFYTDLLHARLMAMQKSREHYAVLSSDSYSIVEDTDDDGKVDADDTVLPSYPRKVPFCLNKNNTGSRIHFDKDGTMPVWRTVWFTSNASPDYDCVVISITRINTGRYDGDRCVAQ